MSKHPEEHVPAMDHSGYKSGEVLADGKVYPNIFAALGFSDAEAAQMIQEVDEGIRSRARRDALFRAVMGKPKKVRWGGLPIVR